MSTLFPTLALLQAADRSTLQNVLAAVPRDPASLFVLVLIGAVTVFIIVTGRRTGGDDKGKEGKAP